MTEMVPVCSRMMSRRDNKLRQIMCKNLQILAVELSDDIGALFKALSDRRIKKVPVLEAGRMVGTASRSDLLRQLIVQSSLTQNNTQQ